MSLSSFCVVTNALRLNRVRVHDASGDRPLRKKKRAASGEHVYTVQIEGMMCENCERHVREALTKLHGASAEADHASGQERVTSPVPLTEKELRRAVREAGYKVTAVREEE